MTPIAVEGKPTDTLAGEVDPHPALITQLAGIVKEAETPHVEDEAKVTPWCYFLPCAGVRYYTYEEHPSPVKGVKRVDR